MTPLNKRIEDIWKEYKKIFTMHLPTKGGENKIILNPMEFIILEKIVKSSLTTIAKEVADEMMLEERKCDLCEYPYPECDCFGYNQAVSDLEDKREKLNILKNVHTHN